MQLRSFLRSPSLSRSRVLAAGLLLSAAGCTEDTTAPGTDSDADPIIEPGPSEPQMPNDDWETPAPIVPADPVDPGPDLSLCSLKGSEVSVFGDSYIALDPSYLPGDTHPFVANLEELSRAAGALGADDAYRRYAQSGASLAYGPFIPEQLDAALAEDPNIKLIIMTGGGNDVLVNNRGCLEYATEAEVATDPACVKVVDAAIAAGQTMVDRGAEAGVKAVIYFFYPHLPGLLRGGIGAGTYPNSVLDYAIPRVKSFCDSQTKVACHFVDLRAAFDKNNDSWPDDGMINIDGIHPSAAGLKIMASEVWDVMQAQCIGSEPAPQMMVQRTDR